MPTLKQLICSPCHLCLYHDCRPQGHDAPASFAAYSIGSPPHQMSKNSDTCISTMAAGPWNMRSLQHLQAVTLVGVQCHADTLAAALPRVPLDRLALEGCTILFWGQHADDGLSS